MKRLLCSLIIGLFLSGPVFAIDPQAKRVQTSAFDGNCVGATDVQACLDALDNYAPDLSEYLTSADAALTYQPIGTYLTDAPSDGSQYLRLNGAWSTVTIPAGTTARGITATFSGSGIPPAVSAKARVRVPYSGTITGWTITSDISGSAVVSVWKDTYANYPPLVGDSISGTEKPTLSSATKNQDLSLTTWSTLAITEGDFLVFNVDSASTLTEIVVQLHVTAST